MLTVQTTLNPIFTGNQEPSPSDLYSNLDDKSLQSEVKSFQEWMVKKYPNFNSDGDIVIVSGVFDDGTKKAFQKYGLEYATGTKSGKTPTETEKSNASKNGLFWDKVKGWYAKGQQSGIFDFAKNAFGLTPNAMQTDVIGGNIKEMPKSKDEKPKEDKTATYFEIGIVVLIAGGLIWYLSKSKKS